jgi:hypothetical protein
MVVVNGPLYAVVGTLNSDVTGVVALAAEFIICSEVSNIPFLLKSIHADTASLCAAPDHPLDTEILFPVEPISKLTSVAGAV